MGRRAWTAVVVWAGLALPAWAGDGQMSSGLGSSAWVDVDPSGKAHVIEMGSVTGLAEPVSAAAQRINDRLRERIESWQFIPATRDGVPVGSRTHVGISLQGDTDGAGGVALRIRSASTGPEMTHEKLPVSAFLAASKAEGWVDVLVAYAVDGSVTTATVAESKAFDGGRFKKHADSALQSAARKIATASLAFKPEWVAGKPVAGSVIVPMKFCQSQVCLQAQVERTVAMPDAEFAAMNPAVKLDTAVAGSTL